MGPSFLSSIRNAVLWQRIPASAIAFKSLDREVSVLLAYSVVYIFAGYFLALAILRFPLPILGATQFNQDVWYSIVFKIILLLVVPSMVYFGLWKYEAKDLLLGLRPSLKNITATIALVSIGFFLNASHLKPIQENLPHFKDASLRLTIGFIMPLFMAAIPEEFFFRGFLQTRLEKKWNRVAAIFISTFLFMAWHLPSRYVLSNGVEGQAGDLLGVLLQTGLPVFIVGLFFSLHWSRYRNIILLILTHWAIDILPSISSYFGIRF